MEFPFDVNEVLQNTITVLRGGQKAKGVKRDPHEFELEKIVNDMGVASAKLLKAPITTSSKLQHSNDHCIYLLKDETLNSGQGGVIGFIKTGHKRLFLTDSKGILHEVEPVCILDFYVHESQQRQGYGKILFEEVLKQEGLKSFEVAIDRPSVKFLNFLKKHYNLQSYVKQSNNFVVFDKFFSTCVHVDYSKRQYKRSSIPNYTLTQSPFNNTRSSMSPIKVNELQPNDVLATNSPSTTSPNTSSVNFTSTDISTTRESLSPWNSMKLQQLATVTNDSTKAPYLTMRNKNRNRSVVDYSYLLPLAATAPYGVQYSRYKTSKDTLQQINHYTTRNLLDTKTSYSTKQWKSFLY